MPDTPTIPGLTIRRPDDWHVHLRDGAMLRTVAPYTARQFARAIVMPNLSPPVTTAATAAAYRDRIMAALPPGADFTPLMTCYLTDDAVADDLVGHLGVAPGGIHTCLPQVLRHPAQVPELCIRPRPRPVPQPVHLLALVLDPGL